MMMGRSVLVRSVSTTGLNSYVAESTNYSNRLKSAFFVKSPIKHTDFLFGRCVMHRLRYDSSTEGLDNDGAECSCPIDGHRFNVQVAAVEAHPGQVPGFPIIILLPLKHYPTLISQVVCPQKYRPNSEELNIRALII